MSAALEPGESIIAIAVDGPACSWQAWARQCDVAGDVITSRERSGVVAAILVNRVKKDGSSEEILAPVTEVELIGQALQAGLELTGDWAGQRVLEAGTALNGMLRVSLHDWVRAGRLTEGPGAFVYAREAWARVLELLQQESPGLLVRWKPQPPA
jgi:hypothetical protein